MQVMGDGRDAVMLPTNVVAELMAAVEAKRNLILVVEEGVEVPLPDFDDDHAADGLTSRHDAGPELHSVLRLNVVDNNLRGAVGVGPRHAQSIGLVPWSIRRTEPKFLPWFSPYPNAGCARRGAIASTSDPQTRSRAWLAMRSYRVWAHPTGC